MNNLPLGTRVAALIPGTALVAGIIVGLRSNARGFFYTVRTLETDIENITRQHLSTVDELLPETVESWRYVWERLEKYERERRNG